MRPPHGDYMDEFDWSTDRGSCWGLTARVVFGFAGFATIAWMAGLIGAGPGDVASIALQ